MRHLSKTSAMLAAVALAATGTAVSEVLAPSSASASDITTSRSNIWQSYVLANSRVGDTPYRYGGTSLWTGADCSGFTQTVYDKRSGANLPRTAEQQRRSVRAISKRWARPGDLVFFGAPAYHMGIYAGNGYVVDASRSGSTVKKRKIWTSDVRYGTLRAS
ncbi:C40 family peptidase [Janibacter sp. UYMM211]|uniref:C40 family peptidase n=1 Tax=Janibacter sp. UYMM211 TaxID=3156342 RepID=UPI003397DCB8